MAQLGQALLLTVAIPVTASVEPTASETPASCFESAGQDERVRPDRRDGPGLSMQQALVPPVRGSVLSSPSLTGGTSGFPCQWKGPRVTPRASALFVLISLRYS